MNSLEERQRNIYLASRVGGSRESREKTAAGPLWYLFIRTLRLPPVTRGDVARVGTNLVLEIDRQSPSLIRVNINVEC